MADGPIHPNQIRSFLRWARAIFYAVWLGVPALGVAIAEWLRHSFDRFAVAAKPMSKAYVQTRSDGPDGRFLTNWWLLTREWDLPSIHEVILASCGTYHSLLILRTASLLSAVLTVVAIILATIGQHLRGAGGRIPFDASIPERKAATVYLRLIGPFFVLMLAVPGALIVGGICVVGAVVGQSVYYIPMAAVAAWTVILVVGFVRAESEAERSRMK